MIHSVYVDYCTHSVDFLSYFQCRQHPAVSGEYQGRRKGIVPKIQGPKKVLQRFFENSFLAFHDSPTILIWACELMKIAFDVSSPFVQHCPFVLLHDGDSSLNNYDHQAAHTHRDHTSDLSSRHLFSPTKQTED